MNTYLPNLVTEDGSHGVVDSKGVGATRLQVPLLLHYNKNNAAQLPGTDQPAGPVTDEVVDYHGKTANVDTKPQPTAREYMLTGTAPRTTTRRSSKADSPSPATT